MGHDNNINISRLRMRSSVIWLMKSTTFLIALAFFITNVMLLCFFGLLVLYSLEYEFDEQFTKSNTQIVIGNNKSNASDISDVGEVKTDHPILFWVSFAYIAATTPTGAFGALGTCLGKPYFIQLFHRSQALLGIITACGVGIISFNIYSTHDVKIILYGLKMHELNIDTSDLIQKAIFWGLIPQLCLWFVVHYCQKYYGLTDLEVDYKMAEGRYRGQGKKLFSIPDCNNDSLRFAHLCFQATQLIETAFRKGLEPFSLFDKYPRINIRNRSHIYQQMIHRCFLQNSGHCPNYKDCNTWNNSKFARFSRKVLELVRRETNNAKLSDFITSAGECKLQFIQTDAVKTELFKKDSVSNVLITDMKLHSTNLFISIDAYDDNPLFQLLGEYMIFVETPFLKAPFNELSERDLQQLVDLFLQLDELIEYAISKDIKVPASISDLNEINKNPYCRGLVLLVLILLYRARNDQLQCPTEGSVTMLSKLPPLIKRVLTTSKTNKPVTNVYEEEIIGIGPNQVKIERI